MKRDQKKTQKTKKIERWRAEIRTTTLKEKERKGMKISAELGIRNKI